MRRIALGLAACLLAIGGLALPVAGENGCVQANPTYVHQVQGFTWLGTVTAFQGARTAPSPTVVSFQIERVFAGSNPALRVGRLLTVRSGPCGRFTGLRPGRRYLVSTNRISSRTNSSESLAAWQIEGDSARFVVMHPAAALPRQLQQASTIAAVLELVAPDATLPPTSTLAPAPPPSPGSAAGFLAALASLLAAGLVVSLLRRRLRTGVGVGR